MEHILQHSGTLCSTCFTTRNSFIFIFPLSGYKTFVQPLACQNSLVLGPPRRLIYGVRIPQLLVLEISHQYSMYQVLLY